MTTVRYRVKFGREIKPQRRTKSVRKTKPVEKEEPMPPKTTDPRASARQLLALAYYVERGLIDGSISSFDEAAAAVGVSLSRLSQIMKLLDLSPEIQQAVLLGDSQAAERRLRGMTKRVLWG